MRTGRLFNILTVTLLGLSGAACGKVSLDLDNLNSNPLPVVKLSEGAEFVAATQKGLQTSKGYTIDSTTGSSFGKLEATTTNGYKVYSTMQGRLISEDQDMAAAQRAAAANH
jgi:hypothetical protein